MQPKNFLFVSYEALIVDTAWQVSKEGHNVKFFIKNSTEKEIGDGFVQKSQDWKEDVAWADVVVFDDVLGMGKEAQKLRAEGKLAVGGTPYTDRLEDDRAFGQEELKKNSINILPYQEFHDFKEAIKFVEANPSKYVIKPSGAAANIKRLLFVGEEDDGKDVIQVLDAYDKAWSKKIKSFQLQKRMLGVEVAVGGFFNGKNFINPINVNFEHKKLFPGNIGPSTGEMGTAMYWSNPNAIFNNTLKKMEPILRQEGYVGYIDINTIVNGNGIYPLEWTSRFGYPTIMIQNEGILTPMGEFFSNLASGQDPQLRVKSGFQVGVRIIVPPYPFDDKKTFDTYSKDAVIIFKRPNYEGVHIEDVKRIDGQWIVAGTSGVVLVVTGSGSTMRTAQLQAYNRVKNIVIPDMYYRTDIGDRWYEDHDRLHNWGYLREGK